MSRSDLIFGVVGILTSISVFVAQGPYSDPLQYLVALVPVLVAATVIVIHQVVLRFRSMTRALTEAKEKYDLLTGTDVSSSLVVRIMNSEGDISYERRVRYELIKDGIVVPKTKNDLIGAEEPISGIPPTPVVLASSVSGVTLQLAESATDEINRGGRKHYDCWWRYRITPALQKKGDFIEYEYSADMPKCEAKAFSEEGALFFFVHEVNLMSVDCTLISPPDYRFELMEYFIEQSGRKVNNILEEEKPRIESNGHSLRWTPAYRKGASYVCRYKLVQNTTVQGAVRDKAAQRPGP